MIENTLFVLGRYHLNDQTLPSSKKQTIKNIINLIQLPIVIEIQYGHYEGTG